MITQHSEYIRKLATQTEKSYRELESMWKIAQDVYNKLEMLDPVKYAHLRESGSQAEEIKNILEKAFLKLAEPVEEEKPEETLEEDLELEPEEEIEGEELGEGELGEDLEEKSGEEFLEELEEGEGELGEEEPQEGTEEGEEIEEEVEEEEEKPEELFGEEGTTEREPKGKR